MSVVNILTVGCPACTASASCAEKFGRDLAEQHRVEGVVAVAVAGPLLLPPLDRLLHRLAALDRGEVDRRRRAAEARPPG